MRDRLATRGENRIEISTLLNMVTGFARGNKADAKGGKILKTANFDKKYLRALSITGLFVQTFCFDEQKQNLWARNVPKMLLRPSL